MVKELLGKVLCGPSQDGVTVEVGCSGRGVLKKSTYSSPSEPGLGGIFEGVDWRILRSMEVLIGRAGV